jgi:hypothetical protein
MVLPRINPDILLAAQLPVVICWLPSPVFMYATSNLSSLFSPFYARNLSLPRRFVRPISESVFDAKTRGFVVLVASLRQKSNQFCCNSCGPVCPASRSRRGASFPCRLPIEYLSFSVGER